MYELGGALGDATVPAGSNLLLSGPPLSGKTALGLGVLEHGLERGEGGILVTNTQSAKRVRADNGHLFEYGTPFGIVDCVAKQQGQSTLADASLVQYASSPEDMTGVGIKFSEMLQEFYSQRGLAQNRALFSSVSTLLMYSDIQTVFRFLHVFTSRVQNADAVGLYVVHPDSHDAKTMNTLSQLFDGFIRTTADGEVETRLPDA